MISTELIGNKDNQTTKQPKHKSNTFNRAFWFNFKANIKSQKKLLIVMCVLHLLGMPLYMVSLICDEIYSYNSGAEAFMVLSGMLFSIALLFGFAIALNSFDYLYKKSKVDMVYSLPLTTRQRFLSDYLSGLCAYTVPYAASMVLTIIIHGLGCFAFSSWAKQNLEYLVTSSIVKYAICVLLIMVMFYTLTVLIASCCGSMFEAVAYNLLANGLIPAVIAVLFWVFFSDVYGIDVSEYILKYISNSSPIGSVIGAIAKATDGIFNTNSLENIYSLCRWYFLLLLTDAIYFVVSYLLYSKRKAEDVSKPFVFKAFYHVTMSAVMFIIISAMIAFDDFDYVPPMLFFSAIVYFICEVVANRGFKKFGFSILRYIATVCGVVVVCLILKGTNGFGIENRVPSASTISSVDISYDGLYNNGYYYSSSSNYNITITDKELIQEIVDFHKDAIENRFESYYDDDDYYDCYDSSYYYYQYVYIRYNTILGGTIYRRYQVSLEQYLMLKDLSLSDSFIESSANGFKETLLNRYEEPKSYYSTYKDTAVKDRKYYIEVSSKLQVQSNDYSNLTYSQITELYNCYKQDLENRTLEDIMTPKDTYCYLNGYAIFDSYENTINFLTSNKYTPPSLKDDLNSYSGYYNYCTLYAPNDITCGSGQYYTSIECYQATQGKEVYSYDSMLTLLQVAQPLYITTEECYIINFNGDMYVIPAEYSQLAQSIYNNGTSSNSYNYSSGNTM